MTAGLISGIGRPDSATIAGLLDAARAADPTYEHVGSTLAPGPRAVRRRSARLGEGAAAFASGSAALRAWAAHRGIGATVHPPGTPLRVDETLLVVLRAGPAWIAAPNRIVGVVEEARRFGFAYGSLPGHPERGEESFVIERDERDEVHAVITIDARPATLLTKALLPLTHVAQHLAVRGYLRALVTATAAEAPPG